MRPNSVKLCGGARGGREGAVDAEKEGGGREIK